MGHNDTLRIKDDGSPERIRDGQCPICDTVGRLASSQVFDIAVCYTCLLKLAKGTGWI